jgi:hypothetical protein
VHFGNVRYKENITYAGGAITAPYTRLYHFDLHINFVKIYSNAYNVQIMVYLNGGLYSQEFLNAYNSDI